jgi:hypothetical protein
MDNRERKAWLEKRRQELQYHIPVTAPLDTQEVRKVASHVSGKPWWKYPINWLLVTGAGFIFGLVLYLTLAQLFQGG